LDEARIEARARLNEFAKGKDPKAEQQHRKDHIATLREALDKYLEAKKSLRDITRQQYRAWIVRYLSDWLDLQLRDITPAMIEKRHVQIAAEVRARREGSNRGGGINNGETLANVVLRALRAILNFAADRDPSLPPNPVKRLKGAWFQDRRRETLVKADDLPAFYGAVCALPNPAWRDFLLLILFTGLRRHEASTLRWDDIDFAARLIRLPASRTKGKRKLDLPMSSLVRNLLVARRALGNANGWVFPGPNGRIKEPLFAFQAIARLSGISARCHDLRRTFVTVAESAEISPLALKCLVNHSTGSDITASYTIITVDRLRDSAQKVCDRLIELCGIEDASAENVTKMPA